MTNNSTSMPIDSISSDISIGVPDNIKEKNWQKRIYRYRFFATQQHTHRKFSKTNYLSGRISFTKNSKQSKNR